MTKGNNNKKFGEISWKRKQVPFRTFFYMANEVISGTGKYDVKVDVYSFAIIMWELFFEESPYYNNSSKKLHSKRSLTQGSDDSIGVGLLLKVVQGMRPIIPFENETEQNEWLSEYMTPYESTRLGLEALSNVTSEYISLMKTCWDENPINRPSFVTVMTQLKNIIQLIPINKH